MGKIVAQPLCAITRDCGVPPRNAHVMKRAVCGGARPNDARGSKVVGGAVEWKLTPWSLTELIGLSTPVIASRSTSLAASPGEHTTKRVSRCSIWFHLPVPRNFAHQRMVRNVLFTTAYMQCSNEKILIIIDVG